jgi:hypothetical protein
MLEKRLAKLNMVDQPFPRLAGSGCSQWYNQLQSITIQLAAPTVKTYPGQSGQVDQRVAWGDHLHSEGEPTELNTLTI